MAPAPLFALLLLAFAAMNQAANVCVLPAAISSAPVKVRGVVNAPLPGEILPKGAAGFGGFLHVVFPTEACPTPEELPEALRWAQLATPTGAAGVQANPAVLRASITIADLPDQAIISLVNFTSTAQSGRPGPQGQLPFTMTTVTAAAIIQSILVGSDVPPMPMVGVSLNATGCTLLPTKAGVRITCPDFATGTPIRNEDVDAALVMSGSLEAAGDLSRARLLDAALVPSVKPLPPSPKPKPAAQPTPQGSAAAAASTAANSSAPRVCVLPLAVRPNRTDVKVSGTVWEPLPGELVPKGPFSFAGFAYVVFPTDACPTVDELPAALRTAQLANPEGSPGIATSLGQVKASVTIADLPDQATITLVNYSLQAVSSRPAANGSLPFQLKAVDGTAITQSLLVEVPNFDLGDTSLNATGCRLVAMRNGTAVALTCPRFATGTPIEAGGVVASLVLKGTLEADGKLSDAKLIPASLVPSVRAVRSNRTRAPAAAAAAAGAGGSESSAVDSAEAAAAAPAASGPTDEYGLPTSLVPSAAFVLEDDPSQVVVKTPVVPLTTMAVISAIPLMILVSAAALGAAYVAAHRAYFTMPRAGGAGGAFGGRAAAGSSAGPVAEGVRPSPMASARLPASLAAGLPPAQQQGSPSYSNNSRSSTEGSADGVITAVALPPLLLQPEFSLALEDAFYPSPAEDFTFHNIRCVVPVPKGASGGVSGGRRGGAAAAAAREGDEETSGGGVVAGAPMAPAFDALGRRVLLHGVSGCARHGQVSAIIGPSGSGKTTLLSILSDNLEGVSSNAVISGTILLGGRTCRRALRRASAFVPQTDVLLPSLTVQETLTYNALLRLPHELTPAEVHARVTGVMQELGLARVAGSLVGGGGGIRGVSGGERRRVTIGQALISNPRLVMMDEPTSGLDSYTAYRLLKVAQAIAAHGRIVLMSVHQPSPDMVAQLDSVMLLACGHIVYSGPPSSSDAWFHAAGVPNTSGRPPAEHMLHAVSEPSSLEVLLRHCGAAAASAAAEAAAAASAGRGGGVVAAAGAVAAAAGSHSSNDSLSTLAELPAPAQPPRGKGGAGKGVFGRSGHQDLESGKPSVVARTFTGGSAATSASAAGAPARASAALAAKAREFGVLGVRTFTAVRRAPNMLLLQVGVALACGLVVGCVFFDSDMTNQGLQNRLGAMFFALAAFGFTSLSIIDDLVLERDLVQRETTGRFYGISSYLTSKLVLDGLLLRVLPAVLYSLISYWMVGLIPEASRFFTFVFVLGTYSCIVGALAVAMSALCRSSAMTTLIMNIILLLWVLVGGFLVNPLSIPSWISWVRWLSPLTYAFEVLAANEVDNLYFSIIVEGLPEIKDVKGSRILHTLGLAPEYALRDAGVLVAFYAGSVALAFGLYAWSMRAARSRSGGGGLLARLGLGSKWGGGGKKE